MNITDQECLRLTAAEWRAAWSSRLHKVVQFGELSIPVEIKLDTVVRASEIYYFDNDSVNSQPELENLVQR